MNTRKITAAALSLVLAAALVVPALAAPVAISADFKTFTGIKLCGVLSAVDASGGDCTFEITAQPKKGTVTLDGACFEYMPRDGKSGRDCFEYVAVGEDGSRSQPARVNVEICKRAAKDTFFYSDMQDSEAHYASLVLRDEGILVGETFGSDSFFYPDEPVTRAQFVALTAAIADLAVPTMAVGTGLSDDDSIPVWARPYIAAAIDCGVIKGEKASDGNCVFRPDDGITRAEAAAIINRALSLPDDGRQTGFVDRSEIPAWASQAVVNTVTHGILKVFDDNTVRAGSVVTREDAAEMLCGMLRCKKSAAASASFFAKLFG